MTHEELLLFGERIRGKRKRLSFTQENVADEIGISLRYYQMIERGEKKVSLDTLVRLSKTLAISVDYMLFGEVSSSENPVFEIINGLSPRQRENAARILQLYADACTAQ